MIRYHPDQEMLLDYASGSLEEEPALVVAAHLPFCDLCREDLRFLEDLGGILLSESDQVQMSPDSLSDVMARLDGAPVTIFGARPTPRDPILPGPVTRYVGSGLDGLRWRRVGLRVREAVISKANSKFKTSLLRINPGTAIPEHTHDGREYTLVLKGGIIDEACHYRRGDVMSQDDLGEHHPRAAEDEECICLVVLDAPVRFTGVLGRLLNPSA